MRNRIKTVACVGAGLIGQGWTALFASKGYRVVMHDIRGSTLSRGIECVRSILDTLETNRMTGTRSPVHARKLIQTTTSLREAVRNAEYVQESVFEDYELKRRLFRMMDRYTAEHTILASSSSALLMSKIQTAAKRPGRCLIVHPFNPAHLIPLVELVPGRLTSTETVESTYEFMKALGKVPIKVHRELPGYVANRLTAAVWREAIDLLRRGAASAEDIDKACRFGPGIRWAVQGPFLAYHLGGGEGGIEYFMDHLTSSFESRWRSLAKWSKLPRGARGKIVRSVKEMPAVKNVDYAELSKGRDERLVRLLRAVGTPEKW